MSTAPFARALQAVRPRLWGASLASLLLLSQLACEGVTPIDGMDGDATWLEQEQLSRSEGIIIEKVAYRSGSLKIYAEICRPDDALQHSVVLWNHGGFAGLLDPDRQACRQVAKVGFVFAASQYRGEGGSEGRVEACRGEVDDVEALLEIATEQPYAKAGSVVAIGGSHGGCVTLDLAIRRPDLRAAVDFSGPGDWAELYNWYAAEVAGGEPRCAELGQSGCRQAHEGLMSELRLNLGGTPAQVPAAYSERSPVGRLAGLTVPTLITHGIDDVTVPYEQACLKRAALERAGQTVAAWYLDESLRERTDGVECGGSFRQASVALAATQKYAFVLYEGQGHVFDEQALNHVITLALGFALAHL